MIEDYLDCPTCGDSWPCSETICENCGARLLPGRIRDLPAKIGAAIPKSLQPAVGARMAARDDAPFPQSGARSAEAGAIITFRNEDDRYWTFGRPGLVAEIVDEGWERAQALDPTFRIVSICTPQTIYTDLQGARLARVGRSDVRRAGNAIQLPEQSICGGKRRHMLHPCLWGSAR